MTRCRALNEALARYGRPEIFNTDRGSQFTSFNFTGALKDFTAILAAGVVEYSRFETTVQAASANNIDPNPGNSDGMSEARAVLLAPRRGPPTGLAGLAFEAGRRRHNR